MQTPEGAFHTSGNAWRRCHMTRRRKGRKIELGSAMRCAVCQGTPWEKKRACMKAGGAAKRQSSSPSCGLQGPALSKRMSGFLVYLYAEGAGSSSKRGRSTHLCGARRGADAGGAWVQDSVSHWARRQEPDRQGHRAPAAAVMVWGTSIAGAQNVSCPGPPLQWLCERRCWLSCGCML